MHIRPEIDEGAECLKAFKLYGYSAQGGTRTALNEAVLVESSELRLSQAWCHFEVDATDVVHRKLLGIDPKHPHMDAENMPELEDQVSGLPVSTDFSLPLNGGGFSIKARHKAALYMDSPNGDGPGLRKQANDFKIKDFIRSAELKPGEEFITDTKLVIGFITPRNMPGAVLVKFKGKNEWLIPLELPVCFMPGVLMRCVNSGGATAGSVADRAARYWVLQAWRNLGLAPKPRFHAYGCGPFDWFRSPPPEETLVVAIVGTVGAPPIVRETKVFTTEYFDFLTGLNDRRELWKATEPDFDAVEDLLHGDIPVLTSNF